MRNPIEFMEVGERKIAIKGIGRLFYQHGYPISLSVSNLKEHGVEVSIYHVADECLKNGWSAKTTYNKIKADFEEDIDRNTFDADKLKEFCYAEYEEQRELIFEYLFGCTTNNVREGKNKEPLAYLNNLLQAV